MARADIVSLLGVSEHCDGGRALVSMVDGDAGFTSGGELIISGVDDHRGEHAEAAVCHDDNTIGSVVYLGAEVFHYAKPIGDGARLVFCLFYAAADGRDLAYRGKARKAAAPG